MEMTGSEAVNMPKTYALNMFKDFVPMCVFSETSQGEKSDLKSISFIVLNSSIAIPRLSSIRTRPWCIHISYVTPLVNIMFIL